MRLIGGIRGLSALADRLPKVLGTGILAIYDGSRRRSGRRWWAVGSRVAELAEVAGAAFRTKQKGPFSARNNGRKLKDAERLNGGRAGYRR